MRSLIGFGYIAEWSSRLGSSTICLNSLSDKHLQASVFKCIQVIAIVPVIQSNTKSKSEYEIRMYAPSYDKHPRCRREGSERLHLAENIKYLREQDGLTQEELAELIGDITPSAIGNWESGIREPELSRIIKMAEFFSMSLDDFILTKLRPPVPLYVTNIEHLRMKNGMKQEDMANLLGLKTGLAYCKKENGSVPFSIKEMEKISDYFGVTLDQLVKKDLSKGAE